MSTITVSKIPDNLKLHISGVRSKINENGEVIDIQIADQIKSIIHVLIENM